LRDHRFRPGNPTVHTFTPTPGTRIATATPRFSRSRAIRIGHPRNPSATTVNLSGNFPLLFS